VEMKIKLEHAFEEREYLRQLVKDHLAQISAQPRHQEIHYHRPRGLIEGPTMSRDTYNISGQAGAVGPGAHAHDMTFQQNQAGGLDLPKLAEELGRLRKAMKDSATGTPEQDKAVADAEDAATKGDEPTTLRYLKSAGTWTLGFAQKIGVGLAVEAIKKAMMAGP